MLFLIKAVMVVLIVRGLFVMASAVLKHRLRGEQKMITGKDKRHAAGAAGEYKIHGRAPGEKKVPQCVFLCFMVGANLVFARLAGFIFNCQLSIVNC